MKKRTDPTRHELEVAVHRSCLNVDSVVLGRASGARTGSGCCSAFGSFGRLFRGDLCRELLSIGLIALLRVSLFLAVVTASFLSCARLRARTVNLALVTACHCHGKQRELRAEKSLQRKN